MTLMTTSEGARSWMERFFEAHSAGEREIEQMTAAARGRARRYPFPVAHAFPLLEWALDRVAPLAMMGRARPAHRLDASAFDALEHKLQHHPIALVRGFYMLMRQAALENVYPDISPERPRHPLDALQGAIRQSTSHLRTSFDVLVIGSGAGGAPVAAELAARGFDVAIVEAGAMVDPESSADVLERHYLNQAMVGAASTRGLVMVMAGEGVGGTTVINSGTSFSPRRECVAKWSRLVNVDMQAALDPWLEEVHARIGITVGSRDLMDGSSLAVERGFAAMGRETFILPRNAPECVGKARCCFGCPSGAKQSTDRAFLPDAVSQGAALFTKTRAMEIAEKGSGVEVLVQSPEGRRVLRARHLVIAAGALSTPDLIRSNRLGDRWREAGDQLKVHPAAKVFALMPEPIEHGGVAQGIGYRPPELPRITCEGIHTPASTAALALPTSGSRHRWWMERYDRLASFGLMVRDRSTGSVRGSGPLRRVSYSMNPEDARDLGAGLLLMAEAMFHAGAERVLLPLGSNCEVASLDELATRRADEFTPQSLVTVGFHPQGTTGIGRVVDTDCKLSGSERIWVGDAGVLPDSPGVNPQVSIMAFAMRLGAHLAQQLGRQ